MQNTVRLIAQALAVPRREASRVLRASRRANRELWRTSRRLSRSTVLQAPATLDWPAARSFNHALTSTDQPFLLATLHLGNYLQGLLALARLLPGLDRITVLRRIVAPELEAALQARLLHCGLRVQMAHSGCHPARAALRALQDGRHVLLLYDVPPSFQLGRCHQVDWFGQPGWLPAGPAMLARAGRAWLWPFAMVPTGRGSSLAMHWADPFRVAARSDEQAASQRLAGLARDWILQAPEAWLLWDYLPAYRMLPATASTPP